MTQALSGPVFGPVSDEAPRQLVILLHGLGADGHDLIGLAPHWADSLPNARFIAPDAPFPCDMAPMGRQWFSVEDRSPERFIAGVETAAPFLNDLSMPSLPSATSHRNKQPSSASARAP